MRWPLNYVVSIALHALVLFGLMLPVALSMPKAEPPRYLEVTLTAAPQPEPLPLAEPPESTEESMAADAPNAEPAPTPGDPVSVPDESLDSTTPAPLPKLPAAPPAPSRYGPVTQWKSGAGGNGFGGRGPGGSGHYFEAVYAPEGISWYDAKDEAVARGGYLATIASRAENEFVFRLIDDPKFWQNNGNRNALGPWLGGYKEPNRGAPRSGWRWVNGGALFYQNWNRSQPDNLGNRENRLHYFANDPDERTPTWNDLNGNLPLNGYIIEYDQDPQSLPGRLTGLTD